MRRIHGVEDILLGFEPKDPGSNPGGSVMPNAARKQAGPLLFEIFPDEPCYHLLFPQKYRYFLCRSAGCHPGSGRFLRKN